MRWHHHYHHHHHHRRYHHHYHPTTVATSTTNIARAEATWRTNWKIQVQKSFHRYLQWIDILWLLQRHLITPWPERIIWIYRRWQPLYDEIKRSIYPKVEFDQGIPMDIDKDSYLSPSNRNLIILDDVMASTSNDSRITELFTEGSHHRNLSVLSINQNLYFSKDPTQRRNCQYMVLFNNRSISNKLWF